MLRHCTLCGAYLQGCNGQRMNMKAPFLGTDSGAHCTKVTIIESGGGSLAEKQHREASQRNEKQSVKLSSAKNGKHLPLFRARQRIWRLNGRQQFLWGFFGGWIVVLGRLWFYASSLTPDASWPSIGFKTCLLCGLWLAFPVLSGLVSRVCDPHHRLIAVFEGASAPALFIEIARDCARAFPP